MQEDQATEAYDAGVIAADAAAAQSKAATQAVGVQTAKLATLQRGIAAFAAASYTNGGLNPIDSLLAGGNPQQLLARAAGVNEVARSNDATLLLISAQREILASAEQTAAAQARSAAAALTKLAADKNRITNVIAQEQGVLSHLQAGQRAELLARQAAARAAALRQAAQLAHAHAAAPAVTVSTARSTVHVPPSASGVGRIALAAAFSQLGKPYAYGAAGPGAYDCSGLVMWAFAHAGVALPHSAAGQYGYGTHVGLSQLQPGDLVFYGGGGSIGHVGIYVGGGEMIDANHSGGWVGLRPLYGDLVGATRL